MRKKFTAFLRTRLVWVALLACLVFPGTGCGGTGASGTVGENVTVEGLPGTGASGVAMGDYAAVGQPSSQGATIALSDGTALTVPAGTLSGDTGIGLRPATGAPTIDTDAVPVSGWYDVGATTVDVTTSPEAPFLVEIPVDPPAAAIGHPGLQLWVVLGPDEQIPVEGTYDEVSGTFRAELLALPVRFTFAVVFNPDVQRLDGSDVSDGQVASALVMPAAGIPWATTDWTIDFDGRKVTIAQARKVLAAARKAARTYSDAGFNEPVLVRDKSLLGDRWHVHLVSLKGSQFEGTLTTTASGLKELSGRLYLDIACIDNPLTAKANSMQAQVAHELLHGIFFGYKVPFAEFTYLEGNKTCSYRSSSGFNEGMATAVGTFIEQGKAIPRPSQQPNTFNFPLGYFDENLRGQAYRNQDFFVFLLRVGTLQNVRSMM